MNLPAPVWAGTTTPFEESKRTKSQQRIDAGDASGKLLAIMA